MIKRISLILAFILAAGLAVLALFFFTVLPFTRYQAHSAAQTFYADLAEGDFEDTFNHVGYYDRYSDRPPEIEFDDARQQWVNRVQALRDRDIYFVDVKKITVRLEDAYPLGQALVSVTINGVSRDVVQDIHFSPVFPTGWKVQGVESRNSAFNEFDTAVSGHVEAD